MNGENSLLISLFLNYHFKIRINLIEIGKRLQSKSFLYLKIRKVNETIKQKNIFVRNVF